MLVILLSYVHHCFADLVLWVYAVLLCLSLQLDLLFTSCTLFNLFFRKMQWL